MDNLTVSPRTGVPSPTPSDDCDARTEKFVSFKLGAGSYAVLAAAVAEVTHPLPLTPVPSPPPGLLGISPLRGDILAALDIRRLLGEPPAAASDPKSKQIVLKRTNAHAAKLAFTVDRIGEIAAIDVLQIRPVPEASEFFIGEIQIEGRMIKVIDHSKLGTAVEPDRPVPSF